MHRTIPFFDLAALHDPIMSELNRAIAAVTGSGQFVGGPHVERFEAEWADYCSTRHAVGVSDGTAALELALRALGVGPGCEVIVPANTFIATWEAIVAAGAEPVPVDVDPGSLLMTADAVERACTERTAAIVAVHLFGQPVDMDAMMRLARRRGLAVVEDAAQAHGASWDGRRVGGIGDVGCFSFYPSKNLGAFGDAGAVVTNDAQIADRVRSLANHGRAPDDNARHDVVGGTGRLDGLQAAVLSAKLPYLETWNAERRRVAADYATRLQGLPVTVPLVSGKAVAVHHLAVVEADRRDLVRLHLARDGVGTGVHYPVPCHRQGAFAAFATARLPVAERSADRLLSLPMGPYLTPEDVAYVTSALERALSADEQSVTRFEPGRPARAPYRAPVTPGTLAS